MEQQRNPYEPTKVPLFDEAPNPDAKREYELEYGGFWIRVGAYFLDFLLLLPLVAIQYVGAQWSSRYFIYSPVPVVLIMCFYYIYLVMRFGGTPGKRALKLRIAMEDGTKVTGRAAWLRYLPWLVFTALSSLATFAAARHASDATYLSLGYLQKFAYLNSIGPSWSGKVSLALQLWMIATVIVMLCNYRRRAIHDFMAGTVVLRERD